MGLCGFFIGGYLSDFWVKGLGVLAYLADVFADGSVEFRIGGDVRNFGGVTDINCALYTELPVKAVFLSLWYGLPNQRWRNESRVPGLRLTH